MTGEGPGDRQPGTRHRFHPGLCERRLAIRHHDAVRHVCRDAIGVPRVGLIPQRVVHRTEREEVGDGHDRVHRVMHVVFGRQRRVVGIVDEGIAEQLIRDPQERGLECAPSLGIRPLGHTAHVAGRETSRPGRGHVLGPDVVVVHQPGRPQDENLAVARRQRGVLAQIRGEAQEALGESGHVEKRPEGIARSPVRRVLRRDVLVDVGPLPLGERCQPWTRHSCRPYGFWRVGDRLRAAGLACR